MTMRHAATVRFVHLTQYRIHHRHHLPLTERIGVGTVGDRKRTGDDCLMMTQKTAADSGQHRRKTMMTHLQYQNW